MTVQKHLFPIGLALGNLTDKQQAVLDYLTEPRRTIDVGRYLHELDDCRYCGPDRTCKFAHPNALRVLESLSTRTDANPRGRGLVIHRKTGMWELTAAARPRDTGELPEGF